MRAGTAQMVVYFFMNEIFAYLFMQMFENLQSVSVPHSPRQRNRKSSDSKVPYSNLAKSIDADNQADADRRRCTTNYLSVEKVDKEKKQPLKGN